MGNLRKKALKTELEAQIKAGAGKGGTMFNFGGLWSAVDKPREVLEAHGKMGPKKDGGWGSWGGSWAEDKSMKKGGVVRGCGIAKRGKTRGKVT